MSRLFRRDRSQGQALVEFALVVPIFFLLVFGLLDLGRAVYINNALAQGAREGGRWGSVQARAFSETSRATIADYVEDRMVSVSNPTVSVTCEALVPTYGCRTGDILIVEVSSEIDMVTPIIGQIIGTLELSSTSRVVVNN